MLYYQWPDWATLTKQFLRHLYTVSNSPEQTQSVCLGLELLHIFVLALTLV